MNTAEIIETIDTNYKNGLVKCVCGWSHELGNGFNQYTISNCPSCTPDLETRNQRKVTYGSKNNYTVEIGRNVYFVMSNGIHVRYSADIWSKKTGLSMRQADRL